MSAQRLPGFLILFIASASAGAWAAPVAATGFKVAPWSAEGSAGLKNPRALAVDHANRVLVLEHSPAAAAKDGENNPPPSWLATDTALSDDLRRAAFLKDPADRAGLLRGGALQIRRVEEKGKPATLWESKDHDGSAGAGGLAVHDGFVLLGALPALQIARLNADGSLADPNKLLDGLGVRIVPEGRGVSSFALGPDGRLYGTIGDCGLNVDGAVGGRGRLVDEGCAFRMEPDGSRFEIFHRGLRQPQGVAFDAEGNAFTIDAGSQPGEPARVVALVDGGDSGWRLGYEWLSEHPQVLGLDSKPPTAWDAEQRWKGSDANPPGFVLPPVGHLGIDPTHIAFSPGFGWPQEANGRLLVAGKAGDGNPGGVWSLTLVPSGAGFRLGKAEKLLEKTSITATSFLWDGRCVVAAEGGLWVVSPEAGGAEGEAAAEALRLAAEDFGQRDAEKLVGLLRHADFRVRVRAQVALSRKPDALARFAAAAGSADPVERRHGIWGLGILARRGAGVPVPFAESAPLPDLRVQMGANRHLSALLRHADAAVRAEAVRVLGEALNQFLRPLDPTKPRKEQPAESYMRAEELPLAAMLSDPSPRVRFFAALTIGRLKATAFYGPVCDFLAADANQDPWLRHAGSFALERIALHPAMITGLERHPSEAVRLGAAVALRRLGISDAAAFINDPVPRVAEESVRAVTDLALDDARLPLAMLLDDLDPARWSAFALHRLVRNACRLGGTDNAGRLIKLAAHPATPDPVRMEITACLKAWAAPGNFDVLTGTWAPVPARDVGQIKPLLAATLPKWFAAGGTLRACAIALNAQHQLGLPVPAEETPKDASSKP